MKRMTVVLMILLTAILLIACGSNNGDGQSFIAKASDFDEAYFKNDKGQYISLLEGSVVIYGKKEPFDGKEMSLDAIIGDTSEFTEFTFANSSIDTKKDQYVVKLDDTELVFTKVGDRIIKDELGNHYTTSKYPE